MKLECSNTKSITWEVCLRLRTCSSKALGCGRHQHANSCAEMIPKALLEDRASQLSQTLGPKVGPVEIQNLIGHVRGQMERTGKLLAEQSLDSDSVTDLAEVHEYAKYLGMDVNADPELLFIAAYAMEADVPADWTACLDASGAEYFCNLKTGQTQYQHPMDEKYIKMYQSLKAQKTGATGRRAA